MPHKVLVNSFDTRHYDLSFLDSAHTVPYDQADQPDGFYARRYTLPHHGIDVKTYVNVDRVAPDLIANFIDYCAALVPLTMPPEKVFLLETFGTLPPHVDQPSWKKTGILSVIKTEPHSMLWSVRSQPSLLDTTTSIVFSSEEKHALMALDGTINMVIHGFYDVPFEQVLSRVNRQAYV
jgi:hypothetical protein